MRLARTKKGCGILKKTRQLLKILQEQLDLCNYYLEIQNKKTRSLVSGDIKLLDAILRDDQSFVMRMEGLENRRNELLEEMELSNVTISEVIARHVEDDYKEQYKQVFEALSDVLGKLKKVNELNQKLLKQRLAVVDRILQNSTAVKDADSRI